MAIEIAEETIDELIGVLEGVASTTDEDGIEDAEEDLEDVEAKFTAVKNAYDGKNYRDVESLAKDANRLALSGLDELSSDEDDKDEDD